MRFMVMGKATKDTEAGVLPSQEALERMNRFNDELIRDGIVLGYDGLHPSAKGARLDFSGGGKPAVIDGPFAETKELIAGYLMVELPSLQAAIERFSRAPLGEGEEMEIRQVWEPADLGAGMPQEIIDEELRTRAELAKKRARQ